MPPVASDLSRRAFLATTLVTAAAAQTSGRATNIRDLVEPGNFVNPWNDSRGPVLRLSTSKGQRIRVVPA